MLLPNSLCALFADLASRALAGGSTTCYTAMTNKDPGGYPSTKWTTHYQERIDHYNNRDEEEVASSTSTIPAPAMFTPIQSSLPGSSNGPLNDFSGSKRSLGQDIEKRNSPNGYSTNGKSYPQKVECHKYTTSKQCDTTTVTKTKKSTAKPETVHIKTTTTITSTVCPGAKTTVTSTYTTTKTKSSTTQQTTTLTSTATQIAETTTINAACLSSANFANQVSGMRIVQAEPIPADRNGADGGPLAQFQTDSAFSCCNAAFSRPGTFQGDGIVEVEIFAFDMRRTNDSDPTSPIIGFCTILGSPTTCGATQADGKWNVTNAQQAGPADPRETVQPSLPGPTLGNARCGEAVGPMG